jgi:hydrogenase expression/formation protein HypD
MKYVDEYRDAEAAQTYAKAIARITTRPWQIMEICGGQTHAIVKYGIDQLLPPEITLIHGPGCPVCVTAIELIDKAIAIAQLPEVILCSYGDMLRVPGTKQDLLAAKANGGNVRMVYSPWMRSNWRNKIAIARWSFLRSDLKPLLPQPPSPSSKPSNQD